MSLPRELEHAVVLMLENQSFDSGSALRTALGGDAPQFSAGVLPDRGESQAP